MCGAFAGICVQITDVLDPDANLLRISLACWSGAADQVPNENLDETECQAVMEMVQGTICWMLPCTRVRVVMADRRRY
jgi:hypothetical protein